MATSNPRLFECRLLPYEVASGPRNMAADELLLHSAVGGMATLRFYGWSEPTLSLGYFQQERVRRQVDRLAALSYVRRPSGGAALIHHHEVTYALALPAGQGWQPRQLPASSWLCRMHTCIAAALDGLGVRATACSCQGSHPFTGLLCFHHLTTGDLLIGTNKVVGSAQRRHRGALLQHGAILLAASPHAPMVPGIKEMSGKYLVTSDVSRAVLSELTRMTGWRLRPTDWTDVEQQAIDDLMQTKYMQPAWNQKR